MCSLHAYSLTGYFRYLVGLYAGGVLFCFVGEYEKGCFNFGDGAVLGKTDQGHIGSLLLSEKRIRKVPQLTMDGAVSAVGLKRGVWSDYHELYMLEGRQERWAMSVSEDKIEEGENPLLLSIKAC